MKKEKNQKNLLKELEKLNKRINELEKLNKRINELEKSEIQHQRIIKQISSLSHLREQIIGTPSFNEKLNLITEGVIDIFDADFARIWIIREGDLCEKGCIHAKSTKNTDMCIDRERCLHLIASSGRYTNIDGNYRRVPFGCYKIGRVASSEYPSFITNDVTNDPQVHDHEWAKDADLKSFAGYRLLSRNGNPIVVLAMFSKHLLGAEDEKILEDLANTASYVVIEGLTEENLSESEEKFRVLSEMSPAAIIAYRGNRVVYTNDYTINMTGYCREEIQNMNFWDLFHPEFIDMVKERGLARQKGEEVPERYEIKYITKNGETRWADISASCIIYEGKPTGIAMLLDITERKKAEKALMESEEKFRVLADTAPVAIAVYQGNKDVYVNDYTAQMSGYTKEELYEMDFWDNIHPGDQKILKERGLARQQDNNIIARYEVKYITKSGEVRWADLSAGKIIYDGKPAGIAMLVDITDRKKAEAALQESESMYRTIFYNTGAATIIIGPDTTVLLANLGWEKLTGIPKEAQENKASWTEYIHKDDVERMKEYHYARRKDPSLAPKIYECRVVDAKFMVHNCIVHVDIIPGTKNSVASLIDITELKKAEKALMESEKKYRDLVELLPLMVYETDEKGQITFANQIAFESFGYGPKDLEDGFDISQVIVPEDRDLVKKNIQKILKGEKLAGGTEYMAITKEGRKFPIISYSAAIIRENKPAGIRGIIIDVEEYKNAQEALIESEERYRALYEENPSMYFTVDEGGVVLSVNQYGCEQLGYTSTELIDKPITVLFDKKDKEAALNNINGCVSNLGKVFHWELRKVRKDGSVIWVEESARALQESEGKIVVFIVCEDITERKQAEKQLRASLDEKEVLLREIHHRVKNNMQIISSLLSLQSKYVKDIKDKELFDESKNRVRSMAIIHEKVYQSEDLSSIDLAIYLPEIVYAISNSYKTDQNIDIGVDVDNVSLDIETAIPCGLIVNELLANSLKHAFPDQRLGKIDIKLHTDEYGEITLIVGDDGVGFPEGIDFRNTDSLGLRLVGVFIKQLGGTIEMDSSNGTEFKIVFPADQGKKSSI